MIEGAVLFMVIGTLGVWVWRLLVSREKDREERGTILDPRFPERLRGVAASNEHVNMILAEYKELEALLEEKDKEIAELKVVRMLYEEAHKMLDEKQKSVLSDKVMARDEFA